MNSTHYRLPRDVLPQAYHICLHASPRRKQFSGTLTLQARVLAECASIELNARALKVKNIRASQRLGAFEGRVIVHPQRETVELVWDKTCRKGPIEITLEFAGKLNPGMHGLYLAQDGAQKAIASQCEASDARAIFPCFDEPDLKATIAWTVITDPDLEVITNGTLLKRRKIRGSQPAKVQHTFAPTRVISTYLAAVTIGALQSSSTLKVGTTPCRVWCGVGKKSQTHFAQEVTQNVLPWYEKYFGHKYNYEKLDQVAVPGFDAGAMENVGAIFYRQNLLLMQPETTSWQAQKRIAEVIAHEIAHQWFGNLVTMKWWDDLWLNEAFATWIAYKNCHAWKPHWRMWDDYLASKESALNADAMQSTHPIYAPVQSPAEATELFDVITYEKGCGVLRMAESFLGEKVFQKGIQSYIKKFKNKNAAGADLWEQLELASGKPMQKIMQSWIQQPGFPVISCRTVVKDKQTRLIVRQQRFFSDSRLMQEKNAQLWTIPLVISYGVGDGIKTHRALIDAKEQEIVLPTKNGQSVQFVYPNTDAVSFVRVDLDAQTRQAVLEHGLTSLSAASKMALIADQWACLRAKRAPVDAMMQVLQAFEGETDHAVLSALTAKLSALRHQILQDADLVEYQDFVRRLLHKSHQALGFEPAEGEPEARRVARAQVLASLGGLGADRAVLDAAKHYVDIELQDPSRVDANLAAMWCMLVAQDGSPAELKRFLQAYQKRKQNKLAPELQHRYLYALGAFEHPKANAQVLHWLLDDTIPQEQLRVLISPMLANRQTHAATWSFLRKHWKQIAPRIGAMGLARLVESTGSLPYAYRDEVKAFFTKNPVPEAKRALDKALEIMDSRHALQQREGRNLSAWLAKQ